MKKFFTPKKPASSKQSPSHSIEVTNPLWAAKRTTSIRASQPIIPNPSQSQQSKLVKSFIDDEAEEEGVENEGSDSEPDVHEIECSQNPDDDDFVVSDSAEPEYDSQPDELELASQKKKVALPKPKALGHRPAQPKPKKVAGVKRKPEEAPANGDIKSPPEKKQHNESFLTTFGKKFGSLPFFRSVVL